jgi:hypothetical protein
MFLEFWVTGLLLYIELAAFKQAVLEIVKMNNINGGSHSPNSPHLVLPPQGGKRPTNNFSWLSRYVLNLKSIKLLKL